MKVRYLTRAYLEKSPNYVWYMPSFCFLNVKGWKPKAEYWYTNHPTNPSV